MNPNPCLRLCFREPSPSPDLIVEEVVSVRDGGERWFLVCACSRLGIGPQNALGINRCHLGGCIRGGCGCKQLLEFWISSAVENFRYPGPKPHWGSLYHQNSWVTETIRHLFCWEHLARSFRLEPSTVAEGPAYFWWLGNMVLDNLGTSWYSFVRNACPLSSSPNQVPHHTETTLLKHSRRNPAPLCPCQSFLHPSDIYAL